MNKINEIKVVILFGTFCGKEGTYFHKDATDAEYIEVQGCLILADFL